MKKVLRICELWHSKSNYSYSFFPNDLPNAHKDLEDDAELILSVKASSWEEACQKMYDHLGWGKYESDDLEKNFGLWPYPFKDEWL